MPQLLNEHNYSSYQGIGCECADWSSMSGTQAVASWSVPRSYIGSQADKCHFWCNMLYVWYGFSYSGDAKKTWSLPLAMELNCCILVELNQLLSQPFFLKQQSSCAPNQSLVWHYEQKSFFFEKNRKVMLRTLRRRRNSISIVLAKDNS